jgi:methyl-accepting chemotaxis protein
MKKIVFSHINTWLLIFWAIVMATTIATFLLLYGEITSVVSKSAMEQAADEETSSSTASGISTTEQRLAGLKIRIMLLLSGGIFVIGGLGFLWMRMASRRLARPVRVLSNALSRLSRGKLNETVTLETTDEFSQIATGINELAANLQELLLYIWKQTGQCLEKIEQLENSSGSENQHQLSSESLEHIKLLNKAVHDLREMAKAYVFYDVCLDGDKTLAINDPDNSSANDSQE